MDVAVLFGRHLSPEESREVSCRLSEMLAEQVERRVDVLVMDAAPPTLRCAAIDEGVVILNRDDCLRIEFEVAAIREYLDTEHLRRIQRHYLYERLREAPDVPATRRY